MVLNGVRNGAGIPVTIRSEREDVLERRGDEIEYRLHERHEREKDQHDRNDGLHESLPQLDEMRDQRALGELLLVLGRVAHERSER